MLFVTKPFAKLPQVSSFWQFISHMQFEIKPKTFLFPFHEIFGVINMQFLNGFNMWRLNSCSRINESENEF
jgi:hypothetical protein